MQVHTTSTSLKTARESLNVAQLPCLATYRIWPRLGSNAGPNADLPPKHCHSLQTWVAGLVQVADRIHSDVPPCTQSLQCTAAILKSTTMLDSQVKYRPTSKPSRRMVLAEEPPIVLLITTPRNRACPIRSWCHGEREGDSIHDT